MAPQPCRDVPPSNEPSANFPFRKFPSLDGTARSTALRFIRERPTNLGPTLPERFLLFSNISVRDCEEIVGAARELRFQRGQTIHLEGDPVRRVVLLTSGSAKEVQFGQNGTEVILRLCGPGELVGTPTPRQHGIHRSNSQALRASAALAWEMEVFESLARRFPVLRFNAGLILIKQLNDMEERFREVSTELVVSRLSRQLICLRDQVGVPIKEGVEIRISREELAQLIGTTLYTVSRLLSEWDRRGIVVARRESVLINDLGALENFFHSID